MPMPSLYHPESKRKYRELVSLAQKSVVMEEEVIVGGRTVLRRRKTNDYVFFLESIESKCK